MQDIIRNNSEIFYDEDRVQFGISTQDSAHRLPNAHLTDQEESIIAQYNTLLSARNRLMSNTNYSNEQYKNMVSNHSVDPTKLNFPLLDSLIREELIINGVDIETMDRETVKALTGSKPEYLTMPSSFGFWAMFMVLYIFGTKTGCCGMNWLQKVFFGKKRVEIVPNNMSRHTSLTTFMELNVMMWTVYLLLMFLYDPAFFGDSHPVTIVVALICLVGAVFIFRKELHIQGWGPNLRMAIACVLVLWTAVEVFARNGLLQEFWVEPQEHVTEIVTMAIFFVALTIFLIARAHKSKVTEK
jgi:hypothetical protein